MVKTHQAVNGSHNMHYTSYYELSTVKREKLVAIIFGGFENKYHNLAKI